MGHIHHPTSEPADEAGREGDDEQGWRTVAIERALIIAELRAELARAERLLYLAGLR